MSDTWRKWLIARPIAHRGLHSAAGQTAGTGVVENSLAAAEAAITRRFAIECDVQWTVDEQAIVFHDFELDRLTTGTGLVATRTAEAIAALDYRGGPGHVPTLEHFLAVVDGRTPVIVEVKSSFSGNTRAAARISQIVAASNTPVALKSFDPAIMAYLRQNRGALGISHVPLGMVAQASYADGEWQRLNAATIASLTHFLHWDKTRPDFLSWNVNDFPHATPNLLRTALNAPILTWTVRSQPQRVTSMQWADQIIFEESDKLRVE
ncbi:MAG: glycerophosphodiester phosphodiesterase [Hyphomicrobiales bacterium]|nr:glycerophosphodiester phosphodiesterase [Hyphomicrobiales bacterium]